MTLLREYCPADPKSLWDKLRDLIYDDYDLKYVLQSMNHTNSSPNEVYDYGLYLLDEELHKLTDSSDRCPVVPHIQGSWATAERLQNYNILDQLSVRDQFRERF